GCLTEQIPAIAIAPEVGRDQPEILYYLDVGSDQNAAARFGEVRCERRHGIGDLEVAVDSADLEVNARIGIECQLGDEVRRNRRLSQIALPCATVANGCSGGRSIFGARAQ